MRMRRMPLVVTLVLLGPLAACGGGGGDDDAPADNVPPEARLAATPDLVAVGAEVRFSVAGSIDMDGRITGFHLNFADGSPAVDFASATVATHRFTVPGLYQVTLTVTDDGGASASATTAVNVASP
jgi:PKD repeat protein